MLLRRKIATAAGALALAAPLSSCGFDYATDRVYTPAAGTNDRSASVDVLGASVVAAAPGSGTLVVGLANNSDTEPASLTGIAPADPSAEVTVSEFGPIEMEPQGFVQLAEEDIHLTGTVDAGDVLPLVFEFDTGESVEIDVPVVTACDEFAGFDTSVEGAPSGTEPGDITGEAGEQPSATPTVEEESADGHSTAGEAYDCGLPSSETSPAEGAH